MRSKHGSELDASHCGSVSVRGSTLDRAGLVSSAPSCVVQSVPHPVALLATIFVLVVPRRVIRKARGKAVIVARQIARGCYRACFFSSRVRPDPNPQYICHAVFTYLTMTETHLSMFQST